MNITYDWSKIDKNIIVQIVVLLDLPDISSLCQVNKKFNQNICKSDNFWYRKLVRDYNLRPDGVKDAKIYYQIIICNWNYSNLGMFWAARKGCKDLVEYFIKKGANNWNRGMEGAAEGGYRDLVDFFIQKGASMWNEGLKEAAYSGDKDLVEFFIQKGADAWVAGRAYAEVGKHKELVKIF